VRYSLFFYNLRKKYFAESISVRKEGKFNGKKN